jgi:hypothetical protein
VRFLAVVLILAQVGVIIDSKRPGEARALAQRARQVEKSVRQRLAKGPVPEAGRKKMVTLAEDLEERARTVLAEVPGDIPLSLNEKDEVELGAKIARQVAAWLRKQAARK